MVDGVHGRSSLELIVLLDAACAAPKLSIEFCVRREHFLPSEENDEDVLPARSPDRTLLRCLVKGCAESRFVFLAFSRLITASGTPSHLELTFGTFAGSLADDTMGIPVAAILPCCVDRCFCRLAWYSSQACADGSFTVQKLSSEDRFFFCSGSAGFLGNCCVALEALASGLAALTEGASLGRRGEVDARVMPDMLVDIADIGSCTVGVVGQEAAFRYESLGIYGKGRDC